MNKIVILTGTPGAGKTSILKIVKARSKGYKVVGVGVEMLKIANERSNKLADRDAIRNLSSEEIAKLRAKACERINKMTGNIVLDTHASVKKGDRYVMGFFVDELLRFKNLKALIYIDSKSHDIVLRRARDHSREREIESVEELEQQKEINLGLLATYAAHKHCPIYIVRNEQDNLEKAIGRTRKILIEIFGA